MEWVRPKIFNKKKVFRETIYYKTEKQEKTERTEINKEEYNFEDFIKGRGCVSYWMILKMTTLDGYRSEQKESQELIME